MARIFCSTAVLAVFIGFITVLRLNNEVSAMVRLGVVLSVAAAGVFSLRRTRVKALQENVLTTNEHDA